MLAIVITVPAHLSVTANLSNKVVAAYRRKSGRGLDCILFSASCWRRKGEEEDRAVFVWGLECLVQEMRRRRGRSGRCEGYTAGSVW